MIVPRQVGRRLVRSCTLALCLTVPGSATAGDVEGHTGGTSLQPPVTFLCSAPRLDGVLDEQLQTLPQRHFNDFSKSSSGNPDTHASYRIAYGTTFFYLYIEADAANLTYNDRAYQFGDGFNLVLAKPQDDNRPSNEFYVLAGSAVERPELEWSRKIFWYYNVDHIFKRTSDGTRVEFQARDGHISFELFLPWTDVHPYHPWLSDGIGFNLRFTKAVGNDAYNRLTVIEDDVGAENSPRRYSILEFHKPDTRCNSQSFVSPIRNTIPVSETLPIRIATLSSKPHTETLALRLLSNGGPTFLQDVDTYRVTRGVNLRTVVFEDVEDLEAGNYSIDWQSPVSTSSGRIDFTVLPQFAPTKFTAQIEEARDVLSKSSYDTLQFLTEDLDRRLAQIKPYETAATELAALIDLLGHLERAGQGDDSLLSQRGIIRKAHRSKLDDTLQPYSVLIPDKYDPNKEYPLIVYLHGSASTEMNLKGFTFLVPDCCIGVGPLARGQSNLYIRDHAQEDINEVIDAIVDTYSVDPDKIILTGFSMGGYGTYVTYYERPERFRALASFSGPTYSFFDDTRDEDPDFSNEDFLGSFHGTRMFVYHGDLDNNVPIESVNNAVEQMRAAGAIVEYHVEENLGHERPNEKGKQEYRRWLTDVLELAD